MLSCSLIDCIHGLFANTGGIVISCDSGVLKCYAGHRRRQNMGAREREVEDGRRRIKRGEMEKVPTWMACDRVSY